MTNRGERLIALKSGLSERQLHILGIELDRRRKSTGVAYFLWFFLSWLGIHKFYLGRIAAGALYVIAPWVLILFFLLVAIMAEGESWGGAAILIILFAFLAYGAWWLVDLFTIPRQVAAYNENLEQEIIASLDSRKEAQGLSSNPVHPN